MKKLWCDEAWEEYKYWQTRATKGKPQWILECSN